eukprot:CAMPEP_0168202558 /NCGR_PEP_ID=MMETSP0139_2-20121125/24341_1 /TAXON_ID=44445 /ORGANISM="Pseudo-nitzschia australis, Strain 10249 10 AB" /LENGTH=390 /DNA_ID=CAMNT_0008128263 /DNA_START=229 /DNA_END=1403 /DNA_ORIENTATION=+
MSSGSLIAAPTPDFSAVPEQLPIGVDSSMLRNDDACVPIHTQLRRMGANAFSRRLEAIGLDFKYGEFTVFAPSDQLLNDETIKLLTAGHSQETIDDVVLFHVSAEGIYNNIFMESGTGVADEHEGEHETTDEDTGGATTRTHPGRCRKTLYMLDNISETNNDQLLFNGAVKQHTQFGYGYVFGPIPTGTSSAAAATTTKPATTKPATAKEQERTVTECRSDDDGSGGGVSHTIVTSVYQMGPGNYRYTDPGTLGAVDGLRPTSGDGTNAPTPAFLEETEAPFEAPAVTLPPIPPSPTGDDGNADTSGGSSIASNTLLGWLTAATITTTAVTAATAVALSFFLSTGSYGTSGKTETKRDNDDKAEPINQINENVALDDESDGCLDKNAKEK